MGYTIDEIETAILSTLNQAPISGYIRTRDSYQGDLEGEIKEIIVTFPAIFVVFQEATYTEMAFEVVDATLSFLVMVCARSLRSNKAARAGAAGGVGTYQMLEDVRGLLRSSQAGLNLDPFRLEREFALFNDKTLSIYAAEYVTKQRL